MITIQCNHTDQIPHLLFEALGQCGLQRLELFDIYALPFRLVLCQESNHVFKYRILLVVVLPLHAFVEVGANFEAILTAHQSIKNYYHNTCTKCL